MKNKSEPLDKSLFVLDCTLRDGGYYNSWDFDDELVGRYLEAVSTAGIDAVEIGFRYRPKNKFLGAFAYCRDHFLQKLDWPEGCLMAVMINAKDFTGAAKPIEAVDEEFGEKMDSPVDIVRICSYLDGVAATRPVAERLAEKGYRVCFNLMQIAGKSDEEIDEAVGEIANWGCVEVLYFADSLGAMDGDDVRATIGAIRRHWAGPLGIHAHDNKGRALVNTLEAIKAGVQWADGTILSMGRGAGNASTEHLLVELNLLGYDGYEPEALFAVVMDDFRKLQEQYGWGYNLLYYLSASYGIHPTYVQEMTGSLHYDTHQMLSGLKTLGDWGANAYNPGRLREAMIGSGRPVDGSWSAKGWVCGRDVLIAGPGPGLKRHLEALKDYIRRYEPFVISLNADTKLPDEFIDVYAVCHHTRLLTELSRYLQFDKPVLLPYGILPDMVRSKVSELNVLDYGVHVEAGRFEAGERRCTIPNLLVAPYAMAAATVGEARRIMLAGFDGYGAADPRQQDMSDVINCYAAIDEAVALVAVTPSTYGIEQSSVYL